MRRIPCAGLALALLLALVVVPSAFASPLLTLRSDGTTYLHADRFLPPAGESLPARDTTGPRLPRFGARAAGAKLTVGGELDRLLAAGAIDQATHDEQLRIYADAQRLRGKLGGARKASLAAVLRNLEEITAGGGLTASRLPALFETVARNREWWASGPLLRDGARVSFEGSRLVWQFYAGEGLQIQWLGTFGKVNGLWTGGYDSSLRELVSETLALSSQRAGGIAWEYLFRFDGGRPPWVSGLAQGTAVQAIARAAVRLNEPGFLEAARQGLGVFREAPPSGVRIATPAGSHYLIYSFAPGLRVLNAFTQAVNGLHDYAQMTKDVEGQALFAAGEAQLRAELPAYDTGGWSRYSTVRDADVHYHVVARDFLTGLCQRLTADAVPAPAPAPPATPGGGTPVPGVPTGGGTPVAGVPTGGGTPVPGAPTGGAVPGAVPAAPAPAALDPTPYCAAAQRWTAYLTQPPALALISTKVRGGRPAAVKLALDKPSYVTLRVRSGGRTVVVLGGQLSSGVRALRWPKPPRSAGRYSVVLSATDITGRRSSGTGTLRVLKARPRKR